MSRDASPAPPRTYRYPGPALLSDYLLSVVGLACTALPLAFVEPAAPVTWVLGASTLLFLVYFARTVCRQLTRIELDGTGIRAVGPLAAAIRWDALRVFRLNYYATRRDGEEGWMQLKLGDGRRTIRIDSALAGFAEVTLRAADAAALQGIALDPGTAANLEALQG